MTPMLPETPKSPGSMSSSENQPRRQCLLGIGNEAVASDVENRDHISALETDDEDTEAPGDEEPVQKEVPIRPTLTMSVSGSVPSPLSTPQALASQIHPALAALRSSPLMSALSSGGSLGMTPLNEAASGSKSPAINTASPPLIMPSAKCSGYFIEPMKWMECFLESGNMTGRIVCPNKKCGAKLGSYDWAGIECSCKQWVVPGFCIHRSKVDEVVI